MGRAEREEEYLGLCNNSMCYIVVSKYIYQKTEMKKLIICLLAGVCCLGAKAQTPESTKKEFTKADIYHGIILGTNRPEYQNFIGYHLDMHMRKRLWLFTDYSLFVTRIHNNQPSRTYWGFELYTSTRFAFRLNKENARVNYYPYVGFTFSPFIVEHYSQSWANPYNVSNTVFNLQPSAALTAGIEIKIRLNQKFSLGVGLGAETNRGFIGALKFGWNRQYKKQP